MLSFVSGGERKGPSDKEVVTPWFKFLWETYRAVLEILRNNSKLEALYAEAFRSVEDIHGFDEHAFKSFSSIQLVSKGVLSCASQEVRDLYNLLEHEFLPLDLASKVQPLLSKISKIGGKLSSASSVPEVKLSQYISALEKLTTLRVLQQKISVDAVKHNFVAIKVNHLSGAVHFGTVWRMNIKRLLARKSIIEKRKEELERKILEKELTKEAIMELALNEQLKERQEMEKKLQRLAKTMDYLERAKRQEEAPLIEQAFEKRLEEEKILHEQEQLREIELSKQHHAGDLQEKNRLSRMLEHKNAFQEKIVQRHEAEFGRLKKERDERISQLISSRKRERETSKWPWCIVKKEERRKREEAERKAKLDAIAEKQRLREMELEEKAKTSREKLLKGSEAVHTPDSTPVAQPPREPAAAPAAAAAAAAPAPGRYVPKFKLSGDSGSSSGGSQRPTDVRSRDEDRWGPPGGSQRPTDVRPRDEDRWGPPGGSRRPTDVRPRDEDRWGPRGERSRPDECSLRQDGPPARQDAPHPAKMALLRLLTAGVVDQDFPQTLRPPRRPGPPGHGTNAVPLRFFAIYVIVETSVHNVC
ncbi:unnamed protein product [Miscanthus lutarioriparius]|uniref:eIF3a PCI domain-containing protein n=1 Tax=Miscanthus lutarioriparius TaxID=422564 RepID=A0A811ST21_9POAL|nr:unnamed protein product [Miscanthus lutarioriparius]